MSFVPSLRRNLAYLRLSILAKLQLRWLFFISVLLGPCIQFGIEALFWTGCFEVSKSTEIGGFTLSQYLTYLLWLIINLGAANWRFERAMIRDINTGAVNATLVRPGSFYGLHFGDLLGFKLLGLLLLIPLALSLATFLELPLFYERVPIAICMGLLYLLFVFTINFTLASFAFFFDHVYSLNTTKNMLLWFFTGDLFPLDLLPEAWSSWIIRLPFSCGTYLPASYISGRISHDQFFQGFLSLAIGMLIMVPLARIAWKQGTRVYTGTGS